jgi:hypothetical protein
MAKADIDLAQLLEQNLSLINEILELSSKLVLEVKAEHYWTTFSLETQSQLMNIARNLAKLLDLTEPNWGKGQQLFVNEEAMKLWRTAAGLLRALPKVRTRYVEQLARRRRQRIMGHEMEDIEELDPEVLAEEEKRFRQYQGELRKAVEALKILIERIPEGLAPTPEQIELARSGKPIAAAPATDEKPAEAVGAEAQPGQPPAPAPDKPSVAEPDDMSPV